MDMTRRWVGGIVEDSPSGNWIKNMFVSESYDRGHTWVNEQQVSSFMQCSGNMSYLKDGTLVLQYLHRYNGGPVSDVIIRARVSYDDGKTWESEEYILSEGENYPGGIALPDGGMISLCPHRGQIQAVHWHISVVLHVPPSQALRRQASKRTHTSGWSRTERRPNGQPCGSTS